MPLGINRFMRYTTLNREQQSFMNKDSMMVTSTEVTSTKKWNLRDSFFSSQAGFSMLVKYSISIHAIYIQFINLYLFKCIFEKIYWEAKTNGLHQVCNKEKDPGNRSSDWQAARFSTWPFWALCPAEISWNLLYVTLLSNPCFLSSKSWDLTFGFILGLF